MKPKISVIVPVYNVKRYLPECVESLMGQTLQEIEIILIDDGSTDGSGELCEVFAKRDERIKAYHQENAGLSGARNTGIQMASAPWLMFLDGDDWLEPDAAESLLEKAAPDIEMVVGSFCRAYTNGEWAAYPDDIPEQKFSVAEYGKYLRGLSIATYNSFPAMFPDEMRCGPHMNSACFRLYRRDIILENRLTMPVADAIGEDQIFNLWYLGKTSQVFFLNKVIYHYRQRQNSLCHRAEDLCQRTMLHSQCMVEACRQLGITREMQDYIGARACKDVSDLMFLYAKESGGKVKRREAMKQIGMLCNEPNHANAIQKTSLRFFAGKRDALVTLLVRLHLTKAAFALVRRIANRSKGGQNNMFS